MSRNCNHVETVDGVHYTPCPNRTWWNFDGVFCQLLGCFVHWHPRQNVYSRTEEEPTTHFPEGCPHHVPCASNESHEEVTRKYAEKIKDILKAAISDGCDDDEVLWLAKVFQDQSATLGEQNPSGLVVAHESNKEDCHG